MLVRFGYDLVEHEHPWDGEWIDDAFEAAAVDLRSTGAKLLRVLDRLDPEAVDPEATPLDVDLAHAYLARLLRGVSVCVPGCFGVDGLPLAPARGDLAAVAEACTAVDPGVARALRLPEGVDLDGPTHARDLWFVVDAAARPALPKATARLRAESADVTAEAIARLDRTLALLCPWLDGVLLALQRAVAARADDGDGLLERWSETDWSVVGRATPALARHLPPAR